MKKSPRPSALVVETSPATRATAVSRLKTLGLRVTAVSAVNEAFDSIENRSFDVVVCSYIGLRRGGLELYWHLKKEGRPEARSFVLTGVSPGLIASDVVVLPSPLDFDALADSVLALLGAGNKAVS